MSGQKCVLDDVESKGLKHWLQLARERYGISDAIVTKVLDDVRGGRNTREWKQLIQGLKGCGENKRSRFAASLHVAVLAMSLAAMWLAEWSTLSWLQTAGLALTLFKVRALLSLLYKVLWYGTGLNVKIILALTVANFFVSRRLQGARGLILGLATVFILGKMVFLTRTVANPGAFGMLTSMADRVLARRYIVAFKNAVSAPNAA